MLGVLILAILLSAAIVQDTSDHGDYFRADRAWWYVTLLGVAYMVSRGLSKIGSHRSNGL